MSGRPPPAAPDPLPIVRLRGRALEELPSSPWRWLLAPAWLVWRVLIAARNDAYTLRLARTRRLTVPVISIGNLTAGGTGKTPAVRIVCDLCKELGAPPVVLSRGYRAGAGGGNEEALLVGDVPVVCDPDRVRGGRRAIAEHRAAALVLDDGFQHRRLARDLDIVLIDATDPWGGGAVLPLGRLREPLRALRRAHLIWLTRADLISEDERVRLLARLATWGRPVACAWQGQATLRPLHGGDGSDPSALGSRALLCSGIGNARAFELTAQRAGLSLAASWRFPDHHHFDAADVAAIDAAARAAGAIAVCTAKDAVKLAALVPPTEAARWRVLESAPVLAPGSLALVRDAVAKALART